MKILHVLLTLCLLMLGRFTLIAQSNTVSFVVYFASDSYLLNKLEQTRLDSFFLSIKDLNIQNVSVHGHTDADASENYNIKLAQRRCDEVLRYSKSKNSALGKATVQVSGETMPVKPNDAEANKRWNRRVELQLTYEKEKETAQKPPHISILLDSLVRYQKFCINPSRDTILVGEDGTILNIKANSFKVPSYQRTCLTIRLREFLTIEDMLMAGLTTTSNGKILESGGMIYIEAIDDMGYPVTLKSSSSIQISIPTSNPIPDMGLFYGHEDSTGFVNWEGAMNSGMGILSPNALLGGHGCFIPSGPVRDCPLFFCGFRRFFRRLIGRVDFVGPLPANTNDCRRRLDSLFQGYGVDNYQDYAMAINKDLMDSLNLTTFDQLEQYLVTQALEESKLRLQSGEVSTDEMTYYAFSSSNLGWINCDKFSDLNNLVKTDLLISIENPNDYQVFIVFPKIKAILSTEDIEGVEILFKDLPKRTRITLVLMKNAGGGFVELSIQDANTSDNKIDTFNFERISIDDLPERLAGL